MEFFSEEQCQQSLMDSPVYNPFSIQGKSEEMSNEFFFPSFFNQLESFSTGSASLLMETFSSTTVKPGESRSKKREQINFICQNTAQSKSKKRRTKNASSGKKRLEEKQQPPTDYIHVRARRGQATDSHSLAERVRRERISERMRVLQGIVPGCEKVTGKASILDEIINYVESLKNQVEFLSMKLASVSPILYEFEFHFERFRSDPEIVNGNPQLLPSMVQNRDIQSPSESYTSNPLLPMQGISAFPQDDGSFLMQNEELDFQVDHCSIYDIQ